MIKTNQEVKDSAEVLEAKCKRLAEELAKIDGASNACIEIRQVLYEYRERKSMELGDVKRQKEGLDAK